MSSRTESSVPRDDSAAHNLPLITLRTLPVDEASALLAGSGEPGRGLRWHPDYPTSETVDALTLLTEAYAASGWSVPAEPGWWLEQIVQDGEVVGDVSFHGPPPVDGPREVEIGYHVVEDQRGRGVASRACALVLDRAWAAGADLVMAETTPENAASARVLARNGFVSASEHRYRVDRPTP